MKSALEVLRRLAGKLALFGGGLFFGLAIVELALRAFPSIMPATARQWVAFPVNGGDVDSVERPRHYSVAIEGHPELNFLFEAGGSTTIEQPEFTFTVDTSALTFGDVGFRDDGIDGEPYAVAVGDSFVLGWGVDLEETWGELLEARLGRDVASMGAMGGTAKTTAILTEFGLSLNPSLVLYGFFPNDIEDNAWLYETIQANSEGNPEAYLAEQLIEEYPLYRVRSFLSRNLYTYRLAGYLYYSSQREVCRYRQDDVNYTFDIGGWRQRLDLSNPDIARGMEMALEDIRAARRAAEDAGATFVLLIFPSKEHISLEAVTEECPYRLTNELLNGPVEQLEMLCEQEHMHCFNMIDAMRAEGASEQQIYFSMDAHWNAEGNQLAADLIYDYLVANELVEAP